MTWGPGAAGGFQNALQTGVQLGSMVRQNRERNALLQQREAQNDLQRQRHEQQVAQQAREQRRADLPMLSNLLNSVTDEASYQRGIQVAQQYGIDVSNLPPQYDQQWVETQRQTLAALQSPEGQEALSTAGKIAADMGLQPGTPEFNQKVSEIFATQQNKTVSYQPGGNVISHNPITGESRALVQGAQAQPVQTAVNPQTGERLILRDGQWVPAGGAGSNASGGFPGN